MKVKHRPYRQRSSKSSLKMLIDIKCENNKSRNNLWISRRLNQKVKAVLSSKTNNRKEFPLQTKSQKPPIPNSKVLMKAAGDNCSLPTLSLLSKTSTHTLPLCLPSSCNLCSNTHSKSNFHKVWTQTI